METNEFIGWVRGFLAAHDNRKVTESTIELLKRKLSQMPEFLPKFEKIQNIDSTYNKKQNNYKHASKAEVFECVDEVGEYEYNPIEKNPRQNK